MSRVVLAAAVFSLFLSACSSNNVTVDNSLQPYFDSAGVKGSFALFDNGHGDFRICNLTRYRDSLYPPGATFDILQSLIAVQTGVLKDENSLLPPANMPGSGVGVRIAGRPDTGSKAHPALTLKEGFQDSSAFARDEFRELAGQIGRDTLKRWIDSLQYGNKKMGETADLDFWQDGTLRINADQQLGLLKKLYFNQVPSFFNRTQEIVRGIFATENKSSFRLSYKLAQTGMTNGHEVGWVMGWIEENKHPYFFVVNLESADPAKDLRRTGLDITRKILQKLGFFEGLK
ncbi:MAG TPA: penicillin-binding transpeptidase domain-containing protein [Puia sp.]|nr:penicillin-binding transpeptidase domain-containing protein [Puia sp.]